MPGNITDPTTAFERVAVVNLDRCPDKWARFCAALPRDWPFPAPVRIPAIDGQAVPFPPTWWKAGRGAWGIYRSILRTLERAMSDGIQSVLLLEDDAIFRPTFAADVQAWLRTVPADWGCLYLGGQHLEPPRKLTDTLYECHNVNRCHAWSLQGNMIVEVYHHLIDTVAWKPTRSGKPPHVDHHLGQLHQRHWIAGDRRVLCPARWLVGQAAGKSTISGKQLPDRFWKDAAAFRPNKRQIAAPAVHTSPASPTSHSDPRPIIVVLGPFRGGTSCTAGLLHHLGVSMGRSWSTLKGNPKGTYEARKLAQFCRASFQEPAMIAKTTRAARVAGLQAWAADRLRTVPAPAPIGAKHPALCLMISEILEAWPTARFVAVERPLEESVASLQKVGWWHQTDNEPMLRRLAATRDAALASVAPERVLRIDYAAIVANPAEAAARLAAFAGVQPSPEVLAAAAAWVDPKMKTVCIGERGCVSAPVHSASGVA